MMCGASAAQLQNYQTIDILRCSSPGPRFGDGPTRACRAFEANALYPIDNSNFEFAFDSEAVNFLRGVGPTGVRLNLSPEIRWSSRGPGYFFEPAVGYDFTQYDLQDAGGPGLPSTPTRSLPYARLDTGLVFEREAGSQGQRTQTLEPRLVYSYVPYRNQDELPIFDSGLPDLNLDRIISHQSLCRVGSDWRCQPTGTGRDHAAFRYRLGNPVLCRRRSGRFAIFRSRAWVCPLIP